MKISFTFKDFEPSEHLRKYAERRFNKLNRFIGKTEDAELAVILSVDKIRHKVDVHLTSSDINLSAMEKSEDMYASVDMVLDKVTAQLKKFNEKIVDRQRRAGKNQDHFAFEMEQYLIQRDRQTQRRSLLDAEHRATMPLTSEEAGAVLEEKDLDHIVFLHRETETLHLLYRKKSGIFCLIEMTE